MVAVFLAGAAVIAPASASASTGTSAALSTMATRTTTVALPAARCAQLKAAYPGQAQNPALCLATHVEKVTTAASAGTPQAAPQACWSGTAWFDDYYTEFPGLYQNRMYSTFTYSCSVPTAVRTSICYNVYVVAGHTISNLACWGYATSLPSRAAYEQWTVTMPLGAGSYLAWQRRECYRGVPTGSCSWNWG
jgi:hypothetical protein